MKMVSMKKLKMPFCSCENNSCKECITIAEALKTNAAIVCINDNNEIINIVPIRTVIAYKNIVNYKKKT